MSKELKSSSHGQQTVARSLRSRLNMTSDAKNNDPSQKKSNKRQHTSIEFEEASEHRTIKGWEPRYWREHLKNMREMRANRDAPVDKMGAQKLPAQNLPANVRRYQVLISLMLSSQTRDEVTSAAIQRLQEHGLTPENIHRTKEQKISELIYPVGFYPKKARFIKETTEALINNYDGDIPRSVKELCQLSGVGPKMAYLTMEIGWGECVGIGVDVHVHRISNRLHWLKKPTKTPEDTRKGLEGWLPQEFWSEVNLLMVGFGQTICKPVTPQCSKCLNQKICPLGRKTK